VRGLSGRTVVIGILLLGVGGAILLNLLTRGHSVILPTPSGSFSRPPFSPTATASPLPTGSAGPPIASPQSARAVRGVLYSVRLISPCVALVDFDGSFWRGPEDLTLYEPTQPTTIELSNAGAAELHTAAGQSIPLTRIPGPVTPPACS
jgi:hypothetical protein